MTLYSTPSCPMCRMLAQKMDERHIPYEKIMDVDVLEQKGISHVPVLETDDGRMMDLAEALKFITTGGTDDVR